MDFISKENSALNFFSFGGEFGPSFQNEPKNHLSPIDPMKHPLNSIALLAVL